MIKPLVSIVIVTYNAERHLKACMESIKQQNYELLQLIVIDGGSTDSTQNIIQAYENIVDVWHSESDKGIYDAMNKAIPYVKGQWILFLGADDLLEPGFADMLNELKDPWGIYYGMVDVNGIIYKDPYSGYRLAKLNICHQAIFYSSAVFKKYRYNLKYPIWADWLLNMECWIDPEFKFIYKAHLISKFGTEGLSSTVTDTAFEKDRNSIIQKYFGTMTWLRLLFRELKSKLFHHPNS